MTKPVIHVENLSKAYQIGQIGSGTISRDIDRFWQMKILRKEDPFLKVGEINDRSSKGQSDIVWSLKDINFQINQGDAVGIIGKNGAGKSTLLKLLSRVTSPTTGEIKVKGRIASLLEVGTGFHPELSGRENIYLNGAILGMRKKEITRKMDEIIDFSGVERYVDTPVKRYSSGMYVRLAFAVAAHLESEILIVDEVLAVGDAEFQKKCLGKMGDISKGEGRTVLFVSHNLAAVRTLCTKGIVLQNGLLHYQGNINDSIASYIYGGNGLDSVVYTNTNPKNTDILEAKIVGKDGNIGNTFNFDDPIVMEFEVAVEPKYANAVLGFRIKDQTERNVFSSQFKLKPLLTNGTTICKLKVTIPANVLVPNKYIPIIALHLPNVEVMRYIDNEINFEIEETGTNLQIYSGSDYGCVFVNCEWENLN